MSESGKRDGFIAGETSSFPVVVDDDEDVLPRAPVTVQYFSPIKPVSKRKDSYRYV